MKYCHQIVLLEACKVVVPHELFISEEGGTVVCTCRVEWFTDLALFAIFEKRHISADQNSANFAARN